MKITPTVGRVVWFYPSARTGSSSFSPPAAGQPLAAMIVAVLPDYEGVDVVNLSQIVGRAARDDSYVRFQALDMALRTPGLIGHNDVLRAAAAYRAHIEGATAVDVSSLPASALSAHMPTNSAWAPNLKPGDGTSV